MKRKHKFMQAIKILAPNDSFLHRMAQCVSEDTLPALPGGAALQFVVEMEQLRNSFTCTPFLKPHHGRRRIESNAQTTAWRAETCQLAGPKLLSEGWGGLPLKHALRVKSAEYWLKLGQPAQALHELEALPKSAQKVPWALKVHLAAVHATGEGCMTRTE